MESSRIQWTSLCNIFTLFQIFNFWRRDIPYFFQFCFFFLKISFVTIFVTNIHNKYLNTKFTLKTIPLKMLLTELNRDFIKIQIYTLRTR